MDFFKRFCKGCASSILKGRPPKLREYDYVIKSQKITTKQDSSGCPICEIITQISRGGGGGGDRIRLNRIQEVLFSISTKRASAYHSLDPELCRHCLSSRKILYKIKHPKLQTLVPVVVVASNLIHAVCGKILKQNWKQELQTFISDYNRFRLCFEENAILHYQNTGEWPEYLSKVKSSIQDDDMKVLNKQPEHSRNHHQRYTSY